ncbi:MAG: citramalate synthase [Nitrospinaceae bacterium]|jgi:2-isopropylmalate synthase|nr:citramalate synthase [Nitrospina sp.]MDG1843188.1 citramalate synthase [Nitrospinaceae bacterium]
MKTISIYDTTLRDGSQSEDVSFTVEDKIRISHKLDELGIKYIEGGWPGSNPKDMEFFNRIQNINFKQAKITAFGSTRHPTHKVKNDPNIKHLIAANTDVITIFGKSWDMHVNEALSTTLNENLNMVKDSVSYLKENCSEVIFDAEHFFDGFKTNPEYAMKVLKEAESAGADWIILCDTNGGSLPSEVGKIFSLVKSSIATKIGIHTHNDSELAVANALTAVQHGAEQVQGTINGFGERCGNANLISIIPNLKLKLGLNCISDDQMQSLTDLSSFVYELANQAHWNHQPYVGKSAFAHKGGIHVSAIKKNSATYEHISPGSVGNVQRILISDLSGKSNILSKAQEYGISLDDQDPKIKNILDNLKSLEQLGYQYEGAEASFELLMRDALGEKKHFFDFIGFRVIVEQRGEDEKTISEATVKIRVNGVQEVTAAEGIGPVNALDKAIKKALGKFYPEMKDVTLFDYKVRILDQKKGTQAKTRVLIESGDHDSKWGTVGVSENIIEASWQALIDSVEYKLNSFSKTSSNK